MEPLCIFYYVIGKNSNQLTNNHSSVTIVLLCIFKAINFIKREDRVYKKVIIKAPGLT